MGDSSLKEYKGFKEEPRHKVAIETMVANYRSHSSVSVDDTTPYTTAEHAGICALIEISTAHGTPQV
jgi:hypothetical protein